MREPYRKGLHPTNCEVCGRALTWGCGHEEWQEREALAHQSSTDHLLGDCDCYVSRPGYAAFVTREERREQVASVIRDLVPAALDAVSAIDGMGGAPTPAYVETLRTSLLAAIPVGRGW